MGIKDSLPTLARSLAPFGGAGSLVNYTITIKVVVVVGINQNQNQEWESRHELKVALGT